LSEEDDVPTTRTTIELEVLRAEAERRVRAGESRADVARALDVHPMTLAQWALRGRWRKKDIEAEQGGELQRQADAMIAKLRGEEEVSKAEAKRVREEAAQAVAAVAGRAAAEADARAARAEAEAAKTELRQVQDEGVRGVEARGSTGGPSGLLAVRQDDNADADGGPAPAEEVAPVELAMRSMAKAQQLMRADRLEEAERAARVAWRVLGAAERMDQREQRLQAQFEERIAAAAGAQTSVVTPGLYPDRDPENFDQRVELCWEVVRRVGFLERRAPSDVELEGTSGFGFGWPGADAPWFKRGCVAGRLAGDEAPPVWSFAEAWPGVEGELTLAEKGELELLKVMLARWRTEVDPYNRERAIEAHRSNGTLARAKREWPELFRGLAPETA
jgi:hypothetical protein